MTDTLTLKSNQNGGGMGNEPILQPSDHGLQVPIYKTGSICPPSGATALMGKYKVSLQQ